MMKDKTVEGVKFPLEISQEATNHIKMENKTKIKKCHINRKLLPYKLHYFLFVGALGSISPFFPLIAMESIKLSSSSFAAATLARQLFILVGKLVFGYIADYFNNLKTLFFILSCTKVVFVFSLLLIPPISVDEKDSSYLELNGTHHCQWGNSSSEFVKNSANLQIHLPHQVCFNISNECYPPATLPLPAKGSKNDVTICYKAENGSYQMCYLDSYNNVSYIEKPDNLHLHQTICYSNVSCMFAHAHCTDLQERTKRTCCLFKKEVTLVDISYESHLMRDLKTYQFWVFAFVFTVLGVTGHVMFNLSNTACCEAVQKHNADFGKQILWEAPGWAMFAALSGFLNDYTNSYMAAFIIFTILTVLSLLNIFQMNLDKPSYPKNLLKNIGTVMKMKEFLSFLFGILLNGIGYGISWFYLCWFIRSIHGSQFICGLASVLQNFLGEIPFMFFSGWIRKKIGDFNIITCALVAYCVRYLWLSYIYNPWYVLIFEWTYGISHSVLFSAMASFAKMKAMPGTEATTQAIISSTHDDLGAALGNILSGFGFDYLGGNTTFFYISIYFACCVPISVYLSIINRKK